MKTSIAYRFIKRSFDILASGIALIVLSPIFLIAIIGILVSDPGPIFYLAKRVGKDNRTFKEHKIITAYKSFTEKEIKVA